MSLQHKAISITTSISVTFIILTDRQECDIHLLGEKNHLVEYEVSFLRNGGGLCGVEHYADIGHISLSGKDKVFPNEDLLGFLALPETIDVHFIPAEIRLRAIKHCCYGMHCRQYITII